MLIYCSTVQEFVRFGLLKAPVQQRLGIAAEIIAETVKEIRLSRLAYTLAHQVRTRKPDLFCHYSYPKPKEGLYLVVAIVQNHRGPDTHQSVITGKISA